MRSSLVCRNGEKDSVYWLTSTDLQRGRFCLTLNLSERPKQENPSRLSDILETNPDQKYRLSAKACQGILNRAERRGKELPSELKAALTAQSVCKETESTEAIQPDATAPDGAGGGSYTLNTIDRPAVCSFQERAGKPGGAKEYSSNLSEQEPCQPSTINPSLTAAFMGGQGSKAGSIAYSEELAPSIKAVPSGGNTVPDVLIRDDSGGRLPLIAETGRRMNG